MRFARNSFSLTLSLSLSFVRVCDFERVYISAQHTNTHQNESKMRSSVSSAKEEKSSRRRRVRRRTKTKTTKGKRESSRKTTTTTTTVAFIIACVLLGTERAVEYSSAALGGCVNPTLSSLPAAASLRQDNGCTYAAGTETYTDYGDGTTTKTLTYAPTGSAVPSNAHIFNAFEDGGAMRRTHGRLPFSRKISLLVRANRRAFDENWRCGALYYVRKMGAFYGQAVAAIGRVRCAHRHNA